MRIDEVMNRVLEYDKGTVVPEYVKNLSDELEWEKLGDGFYGAAFEKPGGVSTAVKKNKKPIRVLSDGSTSDSYLNYVFAYASDSRYVDNPYFPQVYSIKLMETKPPHITYEIEMEKLNGLDFIADYSMGEFKEQLKDEQSLVSQFYSSMQRICKPDVVDEVIGKFEDKRFATAFKRLWDSMFSNPDAYVRDPRLVEAINLINRIGGGSSLDLHYGNVMYRATPYGMQFVIVDPLS